MARIEIDITAYIDEYDTEDLIEELLKRHHQKDKQIKKSDILNMIDFELDDDYLLPFFNDNKAFILYLCKLLKLPPYPLASKERIISEINDLF